MTASEIIKHLGGAAALSAGIGLPGNGVGALRVRAWSHRKVIPGRYWAAIAAYSKERCLSVTVEALAAAHDDSSRVSA